LSTIASANSRFSLAFSASKARSRFASLTSSPPYLLFQVKTSHHSCRAWGTARLLVFRPAPSGSR
jgi:hypothetical protein